MSRDVVGELRGLYEAGTRGPWRECGANRGGCTCCAVWSTSVDTHVLTTAKEGDDPEGACMVPKGEAIANAALVAAMHRHLPALLAIAEKAQAVVARWDTPLWKDVPATAVYIGELRQALSALTTDEGETL